MTEEIIITDLMLGVIATIAFFNLDWNIGGCLMGIATVLDFVFTYTIITSEQEE